MIVHLDRSLLSKKLTGSVCPQNLLFATGPQKCNLDNLSSKITSVDCPPNKDSGQKRTLASLS